MGVIELFVLALGLSMDAFAVSICKGLSVSKLQAKHCLICGVYFGGFQALMPLIGWALGIKKGPTCPAADKSGHFVRSQSAMHSGC